MYVTKELGDKVGLSTADEALHDSARDLHYRNDNFYYNVPSMSLAKAEEFTSLRMIEMGITPSGTCGNASSEKKRHLSDASVLESDIKEQKKKEEILDVHVKFITSLSEYQLDHLNKLEKRRKQESEKMQQAMEQEMDELRHQNHLLNETMLAMDTIKINTSSTMAAGLSRFTLLSPSWHGDHPKACKNTFGFDSFTELREYCKCFWHTTFGVDDSTMAPACVITDKITDFEKCLITLMRFHRRVTLGHLAAIWGRNESNISRYIYTWAPRWGTIGRHLSILDVTEELLKSCVPREFNDLKMGKVCVLVDGKVIMTEVCRSHSAIKRAMWSDKTHHDGVLFHAWIIPYGLSVEHTPLHLGRVTEGALVELWGKGQKYMFQEGGS